MELRITGRHIRIDPAVKEYAETKLGGLAKYNQRTHRIEVVLDADENHRITLEAKAHVLRGAPIVVHERHRDAKGAIDLAHDALERALRKEKERVRTRSRRAGEAGAAPAGGPASGVVGAGEEE